MLYVNQIILDWFDAFQYMFKIQNMFYHTMASSDLHEDILDETDVTTY